MLTRVPVGSRARFSFDVLDDFEAPCSSRRSRGPSFYQGLFGPSLLLVLRGGIAYPWGLRSRGPRPDNQLILPLEPFPPFGLVPKVTCCVPSSFVIRRVGYVFVDRILSCANTSSLFHIASATAAIFRAKVSFARSGFVPLSSCLA